jgi:hypothetical protein
MSSQTEGPAPPGGQPGQAAAKPLDASSLANCTDDVPRQLRRRRAASLRLPPLDNGKRDPLDILVSYSREPLRTFWHALRDRGLLTDEITN